MPDLRQLLMEILDERHLTVLFQPMVSFSMERTIGYESLVRGPKNSELYHPRLLFSAAAEYDCLFELEWLATETALRAFASHQEEEKMLFVNVTPNFVLGRQWSDERFQMLLAELKIAPQHLVIELSEEIVPARDPEFLGDALRHFRRLDLKVGVDDFGRGSAGLRALIELLPDWVKTDEYFVRDIHHDHRKQTALKAIAEVAMNYGCKLVAKGLEKQEEYESILNFGIDYGQGYFFGRPEETPKTIPKEKFIAKPSFVSAGLRGEPVGSITHPSPFVTPDEPVAAAAELFLAMPDLHALPVVFRGKVVGILRRIDFLNLWSSRYGRELYGKKPVSRFMERNFIAVESSTPLEKLSLRLTNKLDDNALPDDFIVTENGDYIGVGTVIALLRRITEMQIQNAKQANPLTGLPGNVPIAETIDMLLAEKTPFALCYCDIDNFKPYNDVYGYERGDQVIKYIARILNESIDPAKDFVGHIGGDDFVVIYRSPDWKARLEGALEAIKEGVKDFYDEFDKTNGIYAKDREGRASHFPIMSLSVGVVTPPPGKYHSHVEIAELATETKHGAKKIPGCSIFIDRRNDWGFGTENKTDGIEEITSVEETASMEDTKNNDTKNNDTKNNDTKAMALVPSPA